MYPYTPLGLKDALEKGDLKKEELHSNNEKFVMVKGIAVNARQIAKNF